MTGALEQSYSHKLSEFQSVGLRATVISSSLILLAAIARQSKGEDRVVDFCGMAVSLTIASPIAWEHHYGILLPIFAIMLPRVVVTAPA